MNVLEIPFLKRFYPSIIRRVFILFGKINLYIKINGYFFELDIRESIERKTYFEKNYEKERMNFLIDQSKNINSNVLIDIGAYIGFYSIILAKYFNKVFSFEPQIRNFNVLNKNILRNNLDDKIISHNYGLSDENKELYGHSRKKGKLLQSSGFSLMKGGNEKVSTIIGDNLLKFRDEILTIKIDVEGFEVNVLRGIKNILKNNKSLVQIEIWNENYDNVHNYFKSLNYKEINVIDGDTFFIN